MNDNIREIKQNILGINNIIKVSKSLLGMSNIKMLSIKKKLEKFSKIFKILQESISYLGGTSGNNFNIGLYSNLGFCGQFNHRNIEHDIIFGNKKKNRSNFHSKISNIQNIINAIPKTENLSISVSNKHIISSNIIAKENNILFEGDEKYIRLQYILAFLQYALNLSMFHENHERAKLMTSAIETAEEQKRSLYIMMNKKRQESITNDLSVIFGSLG